MADVTIKRCANNCVHEEQDKMYGKGMRAMNRQQKGVKIGNINGEFCCTVCGKGSKQRKKDELMKHPVLPSR